mmetsp:Transcript_68856/g.149865  ORF Transcript_68856/g.149865 Transcript_68856/m.149865 type:complete len:398 (-) Transcript_68856:136-1329(-)
MLAAEPAADAAQLGEGPSLPPYLTAVRLIGRGAYGQVYQCEDTRASRQVAVKWIRNFANDPLGGKRILREIRLLSAMRHENLLRLLDVLPVPGPDFDDVYIVMPYLQCDLHRAIYSKMKLSESHCQAFICQILRGLNYLHSADVVHRDLKPANVLVNGDCTLRIADFGLARGRASEDEQLTAYVVTRWYRAPELLLLPSGYFKAVDLWSAGCIQAEIRARNVLFKGHDNADMLRRIAQTLGFSADQDLAWLADKEKEGVLGMLKTLQLPECPAEGEDLESRVPEGSPDCIGLLRRLLEKDPAKRISAADALDHPFVSHLHDAAGETTAPRPFAWDFDSGWEPTKRAVKDRVYGECVRFHPEIVARDAEWLRARGFLPQGREPDGQNSAAPRAANEWP